MVPQEKKEFKASSTQTIESLLVPIIENVLEETSVKSLTNRVNSQTEVKIVDGSAQTDMMNTDFNKEQKDFTAQTSIGDQKPQIQNFVVKEFSDVETQVELPLIGKDFGMQVELDMKDYLI